MKSVVETSFANLWRSPHSRCGRPSIFTSPSDAAKLLAPNSRARNISARPLAETLLQRRIPKTKYKVPIKVLGSSSNVLVLTDAAQTSKQRKVKAAREKPVLIQSGSKDSPSPADLLHSTADENRSPDIPDVFVHIEEIRTTCLSKRIDDGLLTREQYEESRAALQSGFSHNQLNAYCASHNTGAHGDDLNAPSPRSSHLYQYHAWTQGSSPFPETALTRLSKRSSTKDHHDDPQRTPLPWARGRIADTILSNCWEFRIKKELASTGELDLRISPEIRDLFFNLHGNGDSSLVARIASEHGARIDSSRSAGLLRITASYKSCYSTLRLINFALNNVRSDTFEVSLDDASRGISMPIVPAAQLETVWANVARQTNTNINAARSKARASVLKITVWSMGPSDADFAMAQKLIVRALDAINQERIPVFCKPYDAKTLRSIEVVGATSSLWGTDQPWLRWTLPEPFGRRLRSENGQPIVSEKTSGIPSDTRNGLQSQFKSLANELIPLDNGDREPLWRKTFRDTGGSQEQHTISASFGLLVFSPKSASSESRFGRTHSREPISLEQSKSGLRRLISGTANMSSLALQFQDLQPEILDQLRIRLVPSVSDDVLLRERPPTIEIGVRYDRAAGTSKLNRIKLVSAVKSADLLMPDFHTDSRFVSHQAMYQHEVAEFPWRAIIQKFITGNALNAWDSNLAGVPSEIILPLPLTPSEKSSNDVVGPDVQVRYQIVSIGYRSQLRFKYAGMKMVYSRILPTEFDGHREEFTFQTSQPNSTSMEARRKSFQHFYDHIITLAYHVRPEDYERSLAGQRPEMSSERAEAEELLSDVMRSTAASVQGNRKKFGARQAPSKGAVEAEVDLLLESIGSKPESSRLH